MSPGSYDPDCEVQKHPTTNTTNKRKRRKCLPTKKIKKPNTITLNDAAEGVGLEEKEVELLMEQKEPKLKSNVNSLVTKDKELLGNSDSESSSTMEVEIETSNTNVIEGTRPLEKVGVACEIVDSEVNFVTSCTPEIKLINSNSTPSLDHSTSSLVHDESLEHQSIRYLI